MIDKSENKKNEWNVVSSLGMVMMNGGVGILMMVG